MTNNIKPQYFIDKADQCFRLARWVSQPFDSAKVVTELDALGNEFLKKAVEIDTERDRTETGKS
jgi:hypothetical protein